MYELNDIDDEFFNKFKLIKTIALYNDKERHYHNIEHLYNVCENIEIFSKEIILPNLCYI